MESSIAAFLMRWSACELLPTFIAFWPSRLYGAVSSSHASGKPTLQMEARSGRRAVGALTLSTVLAQDHFYSVLLSLQMTALIRKRP
jgi:hypothetical protein